MPKQPPIIARLTTIREEFEFFRTQHRLHRINCTTCREARAADGKFECIIGRDIERSMCERWANIP